MIGRRGASAGEPGWTERAGTGWRVALVGVALVATAAVCPTDGAARAQDAGDVPSTAPDWVGPLVDRPVLRTFLPRGGAVVARTTLGFQWSDDGGQTFTPVPLAPATGNDPRFPPAAEVDPVEPNVLYTGGSVDVSAHMLFVRSDSLLYRSADQGDTWQPVIGKQGYPDRTMVVDLTVSPADHTTVYAALGPTNHATAPSLLASVDGGATWSIQEDRRQERRCGGDPYFLQAHPTDAARVFRAVRCGPPNASTVSLEQSADRGRTFRPFWRSAARPEHPVRLVGGSPAKPGRWYLAVTADTRAGGSSVLRTDDDGATWAPVLAYAGRTDEGDAEAWNVVAAGLAFDPARPDTVYVARTAFTGLATYDPADVATSGVAVSTDGGATWADLGGQQMGLLADLRLSGDARTLYLASDQGLFALALPT